MSRGLLGTYIEGPLTVFELGVLAQLTESGLCPHYTITGDTHSAYGLW